MRGTFMGMLATHSSCHGGAHVQSMFKKKKFKSIFVKKSSK